MANLKARVDIDIGGTTLQLRYGFLRVKELEDKRGASLARMLVDPGISFLVDALMIGLKWDQVHKVTENWLTDAMDAEPEKVPYLTERVATCIMTAMGKSKPSDPQKTPPVETTPPSTGTV